MGFLFVSFLAPSLAAGLSVAELRGVDVFKDSSNSRFLSSPFKIRVPCILLLGCNMRTQTEKVQKGTTQEPRSLACKVPFGLWSCGILRLGFRV